MKRKCFLYQSSTKFNKHIYVDDEEAEEIEQFITSCQKKSDYINSRVLEQYNSYYDDYINIGNNITEMRFLCCDNMRIYCKEVRTPNNGFCVVMSKVVMKKTQKINKEIQAKIDVLISYEYEFEQ